MARNIEKTKTNDKKRNKKRIRNTKDTKNTLIKVLSVFILVLVILLGTTLVFHNKIEDYIFNCKLKQYVKVNYDMDLEIKNIEYAPVEEGVNTGDYWNYEFQSKEYPDIKVTGVLMYVKSPEQLKLNIEDIKFASEVKTQIENDTGVKGVEIISLKYLAEKYEFSYREPQSHSIRRGLVLNKESNNIVLEYLKFGEAEVVNEEYNAYMEL